MTIVNWAAAHVVKARWTHGSNLLNDALTALDSAISQKDVESALTSPPYDIAPGTPPGGAWALDANGNFMLTYDIVEKPLAADVTIVP